MKLIVGLLSVVFIFLPLFTTAASATDDWTTQLDAIITQGMSDNSIPGLAIAVIKDDKIIFMKGYGVRDLAKTQPVDENTVFAIASTTKAFTTTAVGMLVLQGKVEWDKPVINYMPGFRMFDPWVTSQITIRDVLCNRSGLGGQSELLCFLTNRDEIVKRLQYVKPEAGFRSQYAYRNTMFIVGGQVIPAVTGISWDDFVRKNILEPLGMKRTVVGSTKLAGMDNVASPHTRSEGKIITVPYRVSDVVGPAGAINSSVRDMAQWVRMQLGNGSYEGRQIVATEVIAETHRPNTLLQLSPGFLKVFPSTHFMAYCMGWVAQEYQGCQLIWHTGGIDGMRAVVGLIPEKSFGLVILTNYDLHNFHESLFYTVVDLFLDLPISDHDTVYRDARKKHEDLLAKMIAQQEQERVGNTRPSLALNSYTGDYNNQILDAKITLQGDNLMLAFGPLYTGRLEHWHYDTFRVTWDGPIFEDDSEPDSRLAAGFITFDIDNQGKVIAFKKDDLDPFLRITG